MARSVRKHPATVPESVRRARSAAKAADFEGVFIAPSVNEALRKLAEEMASPEGGDTEMQRLFFAGVRKPEIAV